MRVAFVSQPWSRVVPPVEQADSIAIWTYEVARRLAARADVTIYSRNVAGRPSVERHDGVTYRRVAVLSDTTSRRLDRVASALGIPVPDFDSAAYRRPYIVQAALGARRHDFDIVHMHQFSQFAPVVRSLAPRAKTVLHMQAEWLTQLDRATIAARLRSVDAVVACSSYLADKIRERFPDTPCFVVPNGVDPASLAPEAPARQADRAGPPRVIFVGRVSPEKAVHVVIEAFEKVVARVPDAELDILGPPAVVPRAFIVDLSDDPRVRALAAWYDGDYYERLQRLVPERLRSRVRFAGGIPRGQLREHYAAAHVLVNPSVSETFGMTLIEALVSGVPVVATPIGGMTDIVADGETGLLAEPGDPDSLADRVVGLLRDAGLRQAIVDRGRSLVLERFTWDAVTARTLEVYGELQTRRG